MTHGISRAATIALCAALGAIIIPVAAYMAVKFPLKLTPDEQSMLHFSPAPVTLSPRSWQDIGCESPMVLSPVDTIKMPSQASKMSMNQLPADYLPHLTFILYEGNARKDIVIIDGHLLRQGNQLNGWKVVRIEQKRVQITGRKGTQWLTIE